jgi:hypothetical protein
MIDNTWLHDNALSIESFRSEVGENDYVVDDLWTAEHEARFQQAVEVVKIKSLVDVDDAEFTKAFADELLACRIVGSVYGVLPYSILSANNGLSAPNRWSSRFSTFLTKLAVQPFFEGEIDSLVTALQYAVICRTDSREV